MDGPLPAVLDALGTTGFSQDGLPLGEVARLRGGRRVSPEGVVCLAHAASDDMAAKFSPMAVAAGFGNALLCRYTNDPRARQTSPGSIYRRGGLTEAGHAALTP
jgi:hypothetical protein